MDITVTFTEPEVAEITEALRRLRERASHPSASASRRDSLNATDRSLGYFAAIESGETPPGCKRFKNHIAVKMPHASWCGAAGDRIRKPGLLGLLLAAGADIGGKLAVDIGKQLEAAA